MGLRSMSSSEDEDAVIRVGTVRRVARRADKNEQMKRRIAGEMERGRKREKKEKREERKKITQWKRGSVAGS